MDLSTLGNRYRNWLDSDRKIRKIYVSMKYYLFKSRMWDSVMSLDNKTKFTAIYRNNLWNNEESRSGGGSTLKRTTLIRSALPALVKERGITSVLDAGCGDFHWMKELDLGAKYIGGDIVSEMIEANTRRYASKNVSFIELDVTCDVIPRVDLILCRECLFHLHFADIATAVANFKKSGSSYLLATHYRGTVENSEVLSGICSPINFEKPPFNFPPPIEVLRENLDDQCLALWRLEDIPTGDRMRTR